MKDCKICDRAGLSVLLVRPGLVATDAAFAPKGAAQLETDIATVASLGLPSLRKSRYVLRMLRSQGFVYVYYTVKPEQVSANWQVFRVAEGGELIPESQARMPIAKLTCTRNPLHPNDVRTLSIQLPPQNPESAGPMWIGYSMNYWDDAFRARVLNSPAAHGMVRILPLGKCGGVAHAFEATKENLEKYIADYALASMNHGRAPASDGTSDKGLESATDHRPCFGGAGSMVKAMKQLASVHTATKDREFVLAIPDPVGMAADANAIRLARHHENRHEWESQDDWVRSDACWSVLEGLRKAIDTGAAADTIDLATRASQAQWNSVKHHDPAYTWSPDGAALAPDGSRAGRLVPKPGYQKAFDERVKRQTFAIAKRRWERITDQIDVARYKAWPSKKAGILDRMRTVLADYEADWLTLSGSTAAPAFWDCFARHYDENDAGKPTSLYCAGAIYARESSLAHLPQAFTEQHIDAWLERTLGRDITDPKAIVLRAGFGNQRSVIDKAHALIIGNWDRSATPGKTDAEPELGDMRDKTVDLLKGVLTHDLTRRFNWLHPTVMALGAGGLASISAGFFQKLAAELDTSPTGPSITVNRYRNRLLNLSVAQHQLFSAAEAAGSGSAPSLSVLVSQKVDLQTAAAILVGRAAAASALPAGNIGTAGALSGRAVIDVLALTDVKTALEVKQGTRTLAGAKPAVVRVTNTQGVTTAAPSQWMQWPTGMSALTVDEVASVMGKHATLEELKLNSVDGRLAVGSMVVQLLGLIQAVPQLIDAINQRERNSGKVTEAGLSTADSLLGLVGGALEKMAASEKAALMLREGGLELAETSRKVAMLRAGAAVTGMLGGGITAALMARKAGEAGGQGDTTSYFMYRASMLTSGATMLTSGVVAADLVTSRAVSAAIGRHALMRIAGLVATEAAATAAAGSIISGAGVVLLLGTIAFAVLASVFERDHYMRWAGRSYFGKDEENKFKTAGAELVGLQVLGPYWNGVSKQEQERLLRRFPAPTIESTPSDPMYNERLPLGA